jgi:hypothetical protein
MLQSSICMYKRSQSLLFFDSRFKIYHIGARCYIWRSPVSWRRVPNTRYWLTSLHARGPIITRWWTLTHMSLYAYRKPRVPVVSSTYCFVPVCSSQESLFCAQFPLPGTPLSSCCGLATLILYIYPLDLPSSEDLLANFRCKREHTRGRLLRCHIRYYRLLRPLSVNDHH